MNRKINMSKLLRILGILILFLNIVPMMTASATSLYVFSTNNANVYIDNVYKGVIHSGYLLIDLPAGTYTVKVTNPGIRDGIKTTTLYGDNLKMIAIPMSLPATNPIYTPQPTPIPTKTPTPYYDYVPVPTATPKPYYTPQPAYTPAPTSSGKNIVINSQPPGANVYSGSTLIGTTPFTYKLLQTQTITFKLAGYSDKVTSIEQMTRSPFKVYLTKSYK